MVHPSGRPDPESRPDKVRKEEEGKTDNTFIITLGFIIVMFIVIILVPLTLKNPQSKLDKSSCVTVADCVCGGIDKQTSSCFIGNKGYYTLYVDASLQCPDFCGGVGGNLKLDCVSNVCTQVAKAVPSKECDFDIDCVKIGTGDKCYNGTCTYRTPPTGGAPECARDEDCVAKNLGTRCSKGTCILKPECSTNTDCVNQGIGNVCSSGRCSAKPDCFVDKDCPQIAAPCICSVAANIRSCPTNKCMNNKCALVNNCPASGECIIDSDCAPASCCHPNSCVPVAQKPNCTSQNNSVCAPPPCKPGTMDCGHGTCQCIDSGCRAVIYQTGSTGSNTSGASQGEPQTP